MAYYHQDTNLTAFIEAHHSSVFLGVLLADENEGFTVLELNHWRTTSLPLQMEAHVLTWSCNTRMMNHQQTNK